MIRSALHSASSFSPGEELLEEEEEELEEELEEEEEEEEEEELEELEEEVPEVFPPILRMAQRAREGDASSQGMDDGKTKLRAKSGSPCRVIN